MKSREHGTGFSVRSGQILFAQMLVQHFHRPYYYDCFIYILILLYQHAAADFRLQQKHFTKGTADHEIYL